MKKVVFIFTNLLCVALGIIIGAVYIYFINNPTQLAMRSALVSYKKLSEKSSPLQLYYNQSTGELYSISPKDTPWHTCVWTIQGDHGSQMTITTDKAFISEDTNTAIKTNKFLPPRVPIYVTCVDWQNKSYYGSIGEYE